VAPKVIGNTEPVRAQNEVVAVHRVAAHGHHGHDHDHDHDHHDHDHGADVQPHAEDALLSARRISLTKNGRQILQRIDLDIRPGEIVTLIGPNGAGKTSLVRVLLGVEAPTAGTLQRLPGLIIGYVPQRFDIDRAIPMTVERFLMLSSELGDAEARTQALRDVGAPRLGDRQFGDLSGGELQRVLIARALLRNPGLLVLDEPVRGVDFAGEAELYTLISQLRTDRKIGVLLVSHDLHVVMAQSDRVICLNRHVCCSGIPHSVAQHPEYARLFGPQAARALGVYTHVHDHRHDLSGEAESTKPPQRPSVSHTSERRG
jgi:zinc transport system ATP-binding protein